MRCGDEQSLSGSGYLATGHSVVPSSGIGAAYLANLVRAPVAMHKGGARAGHRRRSQRATAPQQVQQPSCQHPTQV